MHSYKIARLGLRRIFQELRLFRQLTVLENVLLSANLNAIENPWHALFLFSRNSSIYQKALKHSLETLDFVGLEAHKNQVAEALSYGQQKLLSLACCLVSEPKLLLLDEPVAGVQPAMIEKIESLLKDLVKQKKTILLIEHNMDFVLRVSDWVIVMDDGKKLTEDHPDSIRKRPEILEAYLA